MKSCQHKKSTEKYALFKRKVDFEDFTQKLIIQFYRFYSELYERTVYYVITGKILSENFQILREFVDSNLSSGIVKKITSRRRVVFDQCHEIN
jgi:hypothetical protein